MAAFAVVIIREREVEDGDAIASLAGYGRARAVTGRGADPRDALPGRLPAARGVHRQVPAVRVGGRGGMTWLAIVGAVGSMVSLGSTCGSSRWRSPEPDGGARKVLVVPGPVALATVSCGVGVVVRAIRPRRCSTPAEEPPSHCSPLAGAEASSRRSDPPGGTGGRPPVRLGSAGSPSPPAGSANPIRSTRSGATWAISAPATAVTSGRDPHDRGVAATGRARWRVCRQEPDRHGDDREQRRGLGLELAQAEHQRQRGDEDDPAAHAEHPRDRAGGDAEQDDQERLGADHVSAM